MKPIKPYDELVASLLILKEELVLQQETDSRVRMILFKLNSCLYSNYPHKK